MNKLLFILIVSIITPIKVYCVGNSFVYDYFINNSNCIKLIDSTKVDDSIFFFQTDILTEKIIIADGFRSIKDLIDLIDINKKFTIQMNPLSSNRESNLAGIESLILIDCILGADSNTIVCLKNEITKDSLLINDKNFNVFRLDNPIDRYDKAKNIYLDSSHCSFFYGKDFELYLTNCDYRKYRTIRKPGKKEIDMKDMLFIKEIYKNWWEKSKNKTLKQLHEEWLNGENPLINTDYFFEEFQ